MKIFQLKFCYLHTNNAIKTILILLLFLFSFFNLSAQKERNIKLKIEAGLLADWLEGRTYLSGGFINVEPKFIISNKTVAGLRFRYAANSQGFINADSLQFSINGGGGNRVISLAPTIDYYFSNKKNRPYLGAGLGYNFLTTFTTGSVKAATSNELELRIKNQVGFLLRGGLDLRNFSIGFEYNFIPKADVEIPNGQKIATIDNSYIAGSIGYTIGNEKSPKKTKVPAKKGDQFSVALITEAIGLPFTNYLPIHPGLELKTTLKTRETEKSKKSFNANLGGYFHRKLETAFYLGGEYQYTRKLFNQKVGLDFPVGLGYLHTFYPTIYSTSTFYRNTFC